MFTTGNDIFLYIPMAAFALSLVLNLLKRNKGAFALFGAGFIVYTLYLIGRGWIGGTFLANPVLEGPYFIPWCVGLIAVVRRFTGDGEDWGYVLVLVILLGAFALFYARGMIPPTPKKVTLLPVIFFGTESLAHACFYAGAVFAVLSLRGNNNGNGYHSFLIWGFILYSISQVVGAVWSYYGWGNTFSWNPRHMSSAAIWLLYAAYLHLRFMQNWNSSKTAVYSAAASVVVLVVSYGHYIHEMSFKRIGG